MKKNDNVKEKHNRFVQEDDLGIIILGNVLDGTYKEEGVRENNIKLIIIFVR